MPASVTSKLLITCNDDTAGVPNAVVLQSGELHRGPDETKQDWHDNEAPQPFHEFLYLQQPKCTRA